MKPNTIYRGRPPRFWANVKMLSEQVGYSIRGSGKLRTYTLDDARRVYKDEGLSPDFVSREAAFFTDVMAYLNYRADTLNNHTSTQFMTRDQAAEQYALLRRAVGSSTAEAMNKQKGEKRHPSYLASMVALIAEKVLGPTGFVDDARRLSVITTDGVAEFAFSRRYDGAVPTVINPKAVWEVKEYYGTTTFGSRVADGVYETLLDGFEITEAERATGFQIKHYLFVDDHFTWWKCGRSYLCRMVDMLHTGHVDEVFFGREVLTDWEPTLRALVSQPGREPVPQKDLLAPVSTP